MKLIESIYNIVLEAYSEKMYQSLLDRFISDGAQKEDAVLYIDRFSDIKNNLPSDKRDITKYSWGDLKNVISANPIKRKKVGKVSDLNDSNLVYNENGLKIFRGKSEEDCIKYGEGYSFCISSRGSNSFYNEYRVIKGGTPYFIFDETRSSGGTHKDYVDPQHLMVVFKYSNHYSVTDANNRGEIKFETFEELENKFPRLKGLKNIFKNDELVPKEKELFNLTNKCDNEISELLFNYRKDNSEEFKNVPYRNIRSIRGLIGKPGRIKDIETYIQNGGGAFYRITMYDKNNTDWYIDSVLTPEYSEETIANEIKRNHEQGLLKLTDRNLFDIKKSDFIPGDWYVDFLKILINIYDEYKHGVTKIQLKYK